MEKSLWSASQRLPGFPSLRGNTKTEVLIVGGGLCGILCAYFLKKAGVNCILAEANTIGSGITCNTTGKLTSQHGLIYYKMLQNFGKETASGYLRANQDAVRKYRELAGRMDFDFEEKDSYIYSLTDACKIKQEVDAVNSLGFPAVFEKEIPLPFPVEGAVRFPGQAQFHPLKFLTEISPGLPIYEHTKIRDLAPHKAWGEYGEIKADKIIVATHFPFLNKHGSYFLKLYQDRSYVIALENAQDVKGMYMDAEKTGFSFRNYGNLLLIGGGSHRTGKRSDGWQTLRKFAELHYPQAKEAGAWATQDCMSLDGIPYIGQYSPKTPDLYVASGFNKWGMTGSMAAALLLSDLVQGKENPYEKVFSPERSIWRSQLFINGAEAAVHLLTPTLKRCPHMGCALKWNPHEHTWDCPCHGSRFEEDGNLIDNPATGDL